MEDSDKKQDFRTAGYIRLSREDGDKEESDSVANQKMLLADFIRGRKELSLYDFYIDDGYTGTSFERPAFQRMLSDIESGKINCVVVKDLSRFGRDYIDAGRYLEKYFPEMGVRFLSVSDGIDSQKQSYDMMLPIKNIFNEQYARDISVKIHTTITAKQKAGDFIGSFASYGYKKSPLNKNKLVIDEYPAKIVQRIFALYLQGYGKRQIANLLNREGVLCPAEYKRATGLRYSNPNRLPGGSCWSYSTVNNILHREIYTGTMVQGTKYQHIRGRQKTRDRTQWITVENTHEPIIQKEIWEKTQALLRQRAGTQTPVAKHRNPFAGLIRCGDCGRAMVKNTWQHADGSAACSLYCGTYRKNGRNFCTPHTIPLQLLKEIVSEDLRFLLSSTEKLTGQTLAALISQQTASPYSRSPTPSGFIQKNPPEQKKEQKKLLSELEHIRKRKQSLYEDYKDSLITREEYLAYHKDYRQKETLISGQLKLLQGPQPSAAKALSPEPPSPQQLLSRITPDRITRQLLTELITEIKVYENHRLKITYPFPLPPDQTDCKKELTHTL